MVDVRNYDGSILTQPLAFVEAQSVDDIRRVLLDDAKYPSPVRAMGRYHSLTPCVSTPGTIIDMSAMKRMSIDASSMSLTAEGGLEVQAAADELRDHDYQLMLNIEIGNLTLGSAACFHTKDGLDGSQFGQVSSYVTNIKWVTPDGSLRQTSEAVDPDLMKKMRSSYGLAGIIYEITARIKPLEVIELRYEPVPIARLTQQKVAEAISNNDGLVCWTVGDTCVIQTRNRAPSGRRPNDVLADARQSAWSNSIARRSRRIVTRNANPSVRERRLQRWFRSIEATYRCLNTIGGITLHNPDKIIDYSSTPPEARYAFTFWAFPADSWVENLKAYLSFAESHFRSTGFRCNMPLGSYFIRRDQNSLLSYSYNGDVLSLDPIHAFSNVDQCDWEDFLGAFNNWAQRRGGIPLLNQSPFLTRDQVRSAYGTRWDEFSAWVRQVDPSHRMVNEFFDNLLA